MRSVIPVRGSSSSIGDGELIFSNASVEHTRNANRTRDFDKSDSRFNSRSSTLGIGIESSNELQGGCIVLCCVAFDLSLVLLSIV